MKRSMFLLAVLLFAGIGIVSAANQGPLPEGFTMLKAAHGTFRPMVRITETMINERMPSQRVKITKLHHIGSQDQAGGKMFHLVFDYVDVMDGSRRGRGSADLRQNGAFALVAYDLGVRYQVVQSPSHQPPSPRENGAVAGGWRQQSPQAAEFRSMVAEAEQLLNKAYPHRHIKITEVVELWTQVVAGMNYRILFDFLETMAGAKTGRGAVILYRDLQGQTSIVEHDLDVRRLANPTQLKRRKKIIGF